MAIEVGQAAPDFTLLDTDRKPRSLKEFAGSNVVLAFFPGAFTGGCTAEACAFRDTADKLNTVNAKVVGVSVDSPFAQKGWADANKLLFLLLSDHKREVVAQYGVALPNFAGMEGYTSTSRAVFVIDKSGTVRHREVVAPTETVNYDEINKALDGLR